MKVVLAAQPLDHIVLFEFRQADAAGGRILDILHVLLLEMPLFDRPHKSLASMFLIRRRALV